MPWYTYKRDARTLWKTKSLVYQYLDLPADTGSSAVRPAINR